MNGAIIPIIEHMKEASNLSDALSGAKDYIYIYATGTRGGLPISNGLMIPIAVLTSSQRYIASYNAWGQLQVYISKTTASNLSWGTTDTTNIEYKYFYV